MEPIKPERRQQLLESFQQSKMMRLFQAEVSEIGIGHFEIAVPKLDFMARPAGMFNGSTISALVDVSSGYAAASAKSEDGYFTTVELKVNFLNPAFGDKLIAKAQVVKNGKVLTVVRSDVFAVEVKGKENLVATSLVTLMQLNKKSSDKQID